MFLSLTLLPGYWLMQAPTRNHTPVTFRIRDFDPTTDEAAALAFILDSQVYEHAIAPDRRLDAAVAAEHYAALMPHVAANRGCGFIAEAEGRAIGWAAFFVQQGLVYLVPEARTSGYIAELFVEGPARGQGVGRALIAACEEAARELGLTQIRIGHLTGNRRAAEIYARAGYAPYTSELRKAL